MNIELHGLLGQAHAAPDGAITIQERGMVVGVLVTPERYHQMVGQAVLRGIGQTGPKLTRKQRKERQAERQRAEDAERERAKAARRIHHQSSPMEITFPGRYR